MPIALVVSVKKGFPVGQYTGVTTDEINTNGANLIVIAMNSYSRVFAPTPLDYMRDKNRGNPSWVQLVNVFINETVRHQIYYLFNPEVSTRHIFYPNADGTYISMIIMAFSGADTTQPPYGTLSRTTNSTQIDPGPLTEVDAADLVISGIAAHINGGSVTINEGFTIAQQLDSSGVPGNQYFGGALAYKI